MSERKVERQVLILPPIEDKPEIDDAIQVTAGCGHQCWLSPGSQKHFMNSEVDSKCVPCFGGKDAVKAVIVAGTGKPADVGELVSALRKWLKAEHE